MIFIIDISHVLLHLFLILKNVPVAIIGKVAFLISIPDNLP